MKQLFKLLTVFSFASALSSTAGFGQLIQVDELGKGIFIQPGVTTPLPPAVIAVEPFSGIATLQYTLPFAGTPGDVSMFDVGPNGNSTNDLIRFDGQGHLYFFSDKEATDVPPFDPADVGIPPLLTQFPAAVIQETGVEGQNGASYVPVAGQPGFDSTIGGLQYRFISDVPEPSALALSTTGAIFLLLLRARRITKRD
jgi:hypothetical protein